MPTLRQKLLADLLHRYPFASGCATLANHPIVQALAGTCNELVWAHSPGGRIRCSLSDYVGKAIYYTGDLDPKISWIVRQLVRSGHVALDIGANIGVVTLLLARQVGTRGRVYAFEPNPSVARLLEQSITENALHNVVLEKYALGNEPGLMALSVPRDNAGAGSLVRDRGPDSMTVMVPVNTLASFAQERNLDRLDFIKIDVEGFESRVFSGGLDVLKQLQPPAILFELNEADAHLPDGEAFELLREAGYGFFAIPKCLVRMRVSRFDASSRGGAVHDFLAVPLGRPYEDVAKALRASS